MKYKSKYWHENRGYGRSASFSCKATNQADLLNEILWKLTCSYDLADQDTEMTVLQMAEARAAEGIWEDLKALVQKADGLLKRQSKMYTEKAEAEWQKRRSNPN